MELKKLFKKYFSNPLNTISLIIFLFFVAIAIFPSLFAPFNPITMDSDSLLQGPTAKHWFGTDQFGRDIFSRIVFGIQNSLQIAILSIILASAVGTLLGVIAGYFGSIADMVIMRFIDAMFAFPSLIFALFIIALFGASVQNLIIAIGLVYIPIFARTIRGSTISVRELLYVKASKVLGKSNFMIILKDILPNISSIIIVAFTTNFSTALLSEAALGFLGLGVPPPNPTLGGLVGDGSRFLMTAPWTALFPGLIIAVIVLSINIIGDGLRDTLDPRLG